MKIRYGKEPATAYGANPLTTEPIFLVLEKDLLTSATNGDIDEDGLPDEWEEVHGLNWNDSADASEDTDNDGLTNLQEYEIGLETDPKNPNSFLQATTTTMQLKKTGQTKSYDESGDEVTDNSIKDDGYYQKGLTPSYTRDDETDIVTDHITGLEWQDDEEAKTITRNWEDAKAYCAAKGAGWRLPAVQELQSIVVDGVYSPSIDTTAFVNYNTSNYYWSSTTNASFTSSAWMVYFYNGYTRSYRKSETPYVRCVR